MPRNSQGLYTLPAGNPVVPNTLIESVWANSTMDDLAAALTASLPRDGSAPMTGDLVLAAGGPQTSRSAVSRAYMDSFLAYATGMPVGAIVTFASLTVPPGYLLCNGQAVSRTTFATLFAIIGTTYGAGDGSTTFNVPDLRDQFIRGKGDARVLGSLQAGSFAAHTHAVQDPGHTHAASQAAHSHTLTTGSHSHGVSDPGHTHSIPAYNPGYTFDGGGSASPPLAIGSGLNTGSKTTGITIAAAGNIGGSSDSQQPAVTVASSTTGETIGATGGTETVPQNIALVYLIKAENDTSGAATVVAITSSDTNMIAIDETAPSNPELVIKSNVAFGIPKLDASGKILLSQLPTGTQQLLGYWDASGGQTPSESFPANDYVSGDAYIISVQGTLNVYDPVTLVSSPTVVAVGSLLQYIENSITNPTGWYYVVQSATVVASQVGFTPTGTIGSTNVQAAIAELDSEKSPVGHTHLAADVTNLTAVLVPFAPAGTIAATNVQAAIAELDTEKQSVGPAFSAKRTGTPQSVAVNTYVKAQLNTENFDTDNAFNNTTTYRFTPQVAGYYQVNGAIYGAGVSITAVEAAIYKNGVVVASGSIATPDAQIPTVSDLIFMNGTTDYLELFGYVAATSGGNFDITLTRMSAFLARNA